MDSTTSDSDDTVAGDMPSSPILGRDSTGFPESTERLASPSPTSGESSTSSKLECVERYSEEQYKKRRYSSSDIDDSSDVKRSKRYTGEETVPDSGLDDDCASSPQHETTVTSTIVRKCLGGLIIGQIHESIKPEFLLVECFNPEHLLVSASYPLRYLSKQEFRQLKLDAFFEFCSQYLDVPENSASLRFKLVCELRTKDLSKPGIEGHYEAEIKSLYTIESLYAYRDGGDDQFDHLKDVIDFSGDGFDQKKVDFFWIVVENDTSGGENIDRECWESWVMPTIKGS